MKEKVKKVRDMFHTYHCSHRNIIDRQFRENGLYFGQPPILKYLSMNENATQKEIADHLHISAPSVATSVKRMEEAGLIMRVADKNDARCNNLQLTEKGRALSQYADNLIEKADEATYRDFTEEEINTLISLLERMNNNILVFAKEEDNA